MVWAAIPSAQFPSNPPETRPVVDRSTTTTQPRTLRNPAQPVLTGVIPVGIVPPGIVLCVTTPNPFHYGTPVEGAQFTGRAHEVAGLVSRIRNHVNVVLVSPRRYGKSSVLLRAESELANDNPAILKVNVLRCRDLSALVGVLTANAYRIPGARWHRARQAVPDFLKRFRTNPTVTFDSSGTPSFGFARALAHQTPRT